MVFEIVGKRVEGMGGMRGWRAIEREKGMGGGRDGGGGWGWEEKTMKEEEGEEGEEGEEDGYWEEGREEGGERTEDMEEVSFLFLLNYFISIFWGLIFFFRMPLFPSLYISPHHLKSPSLYHLYSNIFSPSKKGKKG